MAAAIAAAEVEIPLEDRETLGFAAPVGATVVFTLLPTTSFSSSAPVSALRVAFESSAHGSFALLPRPADGGDDARIVVGKLTAARAGFAEFRLVSAAAAGEESAATVLAGKKVLARGYLRVEAPPPVPLAGVCVQTLVTKLLGPLDCWRAHFATAAECGYNAVHLTPPQPLGTSNSAYSVCDQLDVSARCFRPGAAEAATRELRVGAVRATLDALRKEFRMLAIADVVLPHTAADSPWLREHPEAGYSLHACPYLRPAFVLDCALQHFSADLVRGLHGGPKIGSHADIARIVDAVKETLLPRLRLWEFYVFDVDAELARFVPAVRQDACLSLRSPPDQVAKEIRESASRDPSWRRFSLHVEKRFLEAFASKDKLRKALDDANVAFYSQYDDDVKSILGSIRGTLEWEFLAEHGPHRRLVERDNPLLRPYFTVVRQSHAIPEGWHNPALGVDPFGDSDNVEAVANHGWVANALPSIDFAGPGSRAYLRREVIIWDDCTKLRYGEKKEDNPWLWEHMAAYVRMMASMFDGFRIDNCHSVPRATLQFLLWHAREVNPNVYVFAELFAPTHEATHHYAASTGIHALLQEASRPGSQSQLHEMLYVHSGAAHHPIARPHELPQRNGRKRALPIPLLGWVFDLTHDNAPFMQTRTAADALSTSALVSMCACPTGSARGLDELLPYQIDVVQETRPYTAFPWDEEGFVPPGIMRVKRLLGRLHTKLAVDGYSEAYVESHGPLITIARMNPKTHSTVHLFAHCAFKGCAVDAHIPAVTLSGVVREVYFGCSLKVYGEKELTHEDTAPSANPEAPHKRLRSKLFLLEDPPVSGENNIFSISQHDRTCEIHCHKFPPGSVLCFRCEMTQTESEAQHKLDALLKSPELVGDSLAIKNHVLHGVSLAAMNVLLYRCEAEEAAESKLGAYDIPGFGKPTYSGLQGWQSILEVALRKHPIDLGHPLFENLRKGDWALEFTINRLDPFPELKGVQQWLRECLECLRKQPRYLVPKFFTGIINALFRASISHCIRLMPRTISNGSPFAKALALGSVQTFSELRSSPLLDPALLPRPDVLSSLASLAAGLPHFASGYMRSWGRDTFISFKGMLLTTGRFKEARDVILGFASCVRHGLVPNLLDSGRRPRYNARDAVWWFLSSIVDFCEAAPNGKAILGDAVWRQFPQDSSSGGGEWTTLDVTVQEILTAHANGISFREWNAGSAIDDKMQDAGFNVRIYRDPTTGFVHGGNSWNCGTWMDKMGESKRAGNFGTPATPRDGAAVEIVALQKKVLSGLVRLHAAHAYPFDGVHLRHTSGATSVLLYETWADQIAQHFFRCFYVPLDPSRDGDFVVNGEWVNRRGIFKDTVGSSHGWTDFQLRPNFCVAMAVAPELFSSHTPETRNALELAGSVLRGPLGMKTLDPKDWAYRGDYSTADSDDKSTACGFNYHQGPEWLWPFGFYLQALILHGSFGSKDARLSAVLALLKPHMERIQQAPWHALPELTNKDGADCPPSCPCQAWSMATLLDALQMLFRS